MISPLSQRSRNLGISGLLGTVLSLTASLATVQAVSAAGMANAFKVGEVTADSAIVWTRTTGEGFAGAPGSVRVTWWPSNDPAAEQSTEWLTTDPDRDHTRRPKLTGLKPGTRYGLRVEARVSPEATPTAAEGSFRTAPAATDPAAVTFTVVTGQRNDTRDRGDEGHAIYESMLSAGPGKTPPDFFVHTGDVVYYDKPGPDSRTAALARFRWNRMYAYPLQRAFHQRVASYFLKDDHDILRDDCWPGQKYGELTWEEGLAIFAEQTPSPATPYRTVRWGKDLQVWLLEGREFRSPNPEPDGPDKTILGAEQLAWLERTLDASDATFRVVISATPIIGPDRSAKRDNHANQGFQHEGTRLRRLLADREGVYVACGDRHWQYASNDPVTGLLEYCSGPTTDLHAGGFSQDRYDANYHRHLRVQGGFLSVSVGRPSGEPRLTFRHHAVDGSVVHEESHDAK